MKTQSILFRGLPILLATLSLLFLSIVLTAQNEDSIIAQIDSLNATAKDPYIPLEKRDSIFSTACQLAEEIKRFCSSERIQNESWYFFPTIWELRKSVDLISRSQHGCSTSW